MVDLWPLTGRGEELRIIGEALAHSEHKGVVVAGQAGVGKTRLAARPQTPPRAAAGRCAASPVPRPARPLTLGSIRALGRRWRCFTTCAGAQRVRRLGGRIRTVPRCCSRRRRALARRPVCADRASTGDPGRRPRDRYHSHRPILLPTRSPHSGRTDCCDGWSFSRCPAMNPTTFSQTVLDGPLSLERRTDVDLEPRQRLVPASSRRTRARIWPTRR